MQCLKFQGHLVTPNFTALNAGQMGEQAASEHAGVELGVNVEYRLPLAEKVHSAIEKHHTLALLGLCREDEELAWFDGGVAVQGGELEGYPGKRMVLPGLNLRPQFIHHVPILGHLRGGGIFQHDAVQGGINFLLDVLLFGVETVALALGQFLIGLAPKGCVQNPVHQNEVTLHGAAGNGPGVLDEFLHRSNGESGSVQLPRLLTQVEDMDNIEGVDVGSAPFHQLGDGIIEIAILLHSEIMGCELLGVKVEFRMENKGGDDAGLAGDVADVGDVHKAITSHLPESIRIGHGGRKDSGTSRSLGLETSPRSR